MYNLTPINEVVNQNLIVIAEVNPFSNKRNSNTAIEGIKHKEIKPLNQSRRELEIIKNNTIAKPTPQTFEKEDEYSMLGFNDMNNPIKPITSRLGDAVKQEVDFHTAKSNRKTIWWILLEDWQIGDLETQVLKVCYLANPTLV